MAETSDQNVKTSLVKTAAGFFALVLFGSLLAALLGGAFGMAVAAVSPEFVKGLFSLKPEDGSIPRYAFSVGMIWGLFLGIGVSSLACCLTTIVKIIRLKIEHTNVPKI